MKKITICEEEYLYEFYQQVGKQAGGLLPEQVMADALFKLAGELSLHALHDAEKKNKAASSLYFAESLLLYMLLVFFRFATIAATNRAIPLSRDSNHPLCS